MCEDYDYPSPLYSEETEEREVKSLAKVRVTTLNPGHPQETSLATLYLLFYLCVGKSE